MTLYLFSKSHEVIEFFENALAAPYLLKKGMEFDVTCTDIL